MLQKIKRKDCIELYPNFPQSVPYKDQFFYPPNIDHYVLTISAKSVKGQAKSLAKETMSLLAILHIDSLVFLGDAKRAWRYQDNDHKPVQDALQYLADNKVGKHFDGALKVSIEELQEFIVHLFWLQRCNAALPDYHFMSPGQDFVGHICSYGNLHINIITEKYIEQMKNAIAATKFENIGTIRCGAGAISGRQTIL